MGDFLFMFPDVGIISKTYRHLQRYREVATVLIKHEFGDWVQKLNLTRYLPKFRRLQRAVSTDEMEAPSRSCRLRKAFEELGPTFIKLGQLLSTRHDILPLDMIEEFEKLQDTVSPFDGEEAVRIIETDLGCEVEDVFKVFNPFPVASASIAQVHEAITHDGDRVVVKVQRPDIRGKVETDLEIMLELAKLIERVFEWGKTLQPVRVVREFSRVIEKEMDFMIEAANMEKFRRNFAKSKFMKVPRPFREFCTQRVLTMEYVVGTKINRIDQFEKMGLDPEIVAERGARLLLEQIFLFGFFHADPHPGNILVLPKNELCFLDYGMVGILTDRQQDDLGRLIHGIVTRDEQRAVSAVIRLSGYRQFEKTAEIEADVAHFLQDRLCLPLEDIRMGALMNDLAQMLIEYDIRLPSEFFLLSKAVTTIEGVGRRLKPDFDVVEYTRPYVKKLIKRRHSFKRMAKEFSFTAMELKGLLREFPTAAAEILTLLKRGEIKMKFEHRGLEKLIQSNDQIVNRLVFAIVLGAVIVGSALMTHSQIPPKVGEVPIIGVVGFTFSGLMAFWLLWSIFKHGRM